MKILAVIAARGGSKGVKNKNIKILSGKPLIAYTIEQLIKWNNFTKLIVSTNSKKISDTASLYGAETPFVRPSRLSGDSVGKLDVLRHALKTAEKYYGITFDALLDLDATAPIRTVKDIDNIVGIFKKRKANCVFSVAKASKNPYFNMVETTASGVAKLCKKPKTDIVSRQKAPKVYSLNASIYIYDRKFLLDKKNKTPFSKNSYIYQMDDISCVDIDTEIDFKFIEFLLKEGVVKL